MIRVLLLLVLAGPWAALAQSRQERTDYFTATNIFALRQFDAAEGDLRIFITNYPDSIFRTNAILYLARSRFEQSNYSGALELLDMPAGGLATEFTYWKARALYGKSDFTNAIALCETLLEASNATPPLPLRAALLQAQAQARLTNWPAVVALLSITNGVFQTALRDQPNSPEAVDGHILLGEAYFNQALYDQAQTTIAAIAPNAVASDLQWKRQYLLCLIALRQGQLEIALSGSTNLLAAISSMDERIKTFFLRGEILERSNLPDDAMLAYSENLGTNFPTDVARLALRKTIALRLAQNKPTNTIQWLAGFVQSRPTDTNLDLARFHLGDLQLQAFFHPADPGTNSPPPDTNLLQAAITNLLAATNSELTGRAFADLGWCDWARSNYAGAITNFAEAVRRLPLSENQAVALFKLGDSLFQRTNYPAALSNYNRLLQDYSTVESITNRLFDRALYQMVLANVRLGDGPAALAAAERILRWYPISEYGDQGLLLLGEYDTDQAEFPRARATFQELLQKYPDTVLRPDIQLAIAHTYEQEADWTSASNAYVEMEAQTNFATNALLPQVEFSLALACWKSGAESNALLRMMRMSNLVSQFPTNHYSALAQNWIGTYLLNHGDYINADLAFLAALTNAGAGNLVWETRLLDGLAASKHQDLTGASNSFVVVASDTNAPPGLIALAQFQLGYTLSQQFFLHDTNNEKLSDDAVGNLERATNSGPTNTLAALAAGQLGNFFLNWASLKRTSTNTAVFTEACTNAAHWFQILLQDTNDSPADFTARSEAECGLGIIAEWQHDPKEALRHFCNVVDTPDTRRADPFWINQAGVKAAELCEETKDWARAKAIYRRVAEVIPSLRDDMQARINRIKAD